MERKAEAAVIAGVVAAGVVVLALQYGVGYQAVRTRPRDDGTSWAWLVPLVGLPLVAFVGAAAAPHRVRAVVVAALSANVATYLVFKGMTLVRLDSFARQALAWQVALVALTVLAARAGSHRSSSA